MTSKYLFFVFCLIWFGILAFSVDRAFIREGVPQIERAVRHEIDSLVLTNESLRSLRVGRLSEQRMVGNGIKLTGTFYYEGSYSNESWDIAVRWRKSDTNAPIDKIEICSTDQTNRPIWTRK